MKIITYNIHKGMNSNNKNTLNEIGKYLVELKCNIICIQEVLYQQFLKLKNMLKMDGVFVANVNNSNMLYGLCIFTSGKINMHRHILLTSKKEQRGFIHTNISSDIDINIINTHLGLDREERKIQLDEILNYTFSLKQPVILCGDLNEKNIFISSYNDSAKIYNSYSLYTFPKSKSRIDYIYTDKILQINNYKVDNKVFSDHYPVIVEI